MSRCCAIALVLAGLACGKALAAEPALDLAIQTEHPMSLSCAALSEDGRWLLTGSRDGSANLWDVAAGRAVQTFLGHAESLNDVALSHDARRVATASDDHTVIVWDTASGRKIATWKAHQAPTKVGDREVVSSYSVNSAVFHRDGSRLLTAGNDNTAALWDAATGKLLRRFTGGMGTSKFASFSGDGARVLTGGSEFPPPIKQKEEPRNLQFDPQDPFGLKPKSPFDAGGLLNPEPLVAPGPVYPPGNYYMVIVWDVATGRKLQVFRGFSSEVTQAALRADNRRLTTLGPGMDAVVWDARTGAKVHTYRNVVTMSRDGSKLLIAEEGKPFEIRDVDTGKRLSTMEPLAERPWGLPLSNDGQRFVSYGTGVEVIDVAELRSAATGQLLQTFQGRVARVYALALAADGNTLAVGDSAKLTSIWNLTTGRREQMLTGHQNTIMSLGISDNGERVVSSVFSGAPMLWDTRSGQPLHTFPATEENLVSSRISGDGKTVATAGNGRAASVWEAETGSRLKEFDITPLVGCLRLSRDGQQILVNSSGFGCIAYHADTGEVMRNYGAFNGPINCFAWSGDETRIVGASEFADRVTLWESGKSEELRAMSATDVKCVSANREGTLLLTGSDDGTACLWNGETGEKLHTLAASHLAIESVALSGDGKLAFTASQDGAVRMWDAATGKQLASLLSLDAGKEWLVVTPDGLFDGSLNATQFVSYRVRGTLEFVPLDRYQQQFYQPGLLAMLVRGARPAPKVDIAKSLPPKVRIAAPTGAGLNLSDGKTTVHAVAEARGEHPIKTFRLLVDGRPYRGQMGVFPLANPKPVTATASWSIELEPGRHTLKVLADTEYVQGASDEIEVRCVGGGGGSAVELPSLFVLSIGVSKYPGTRKLDYAAADAEAIARSFQERSPALFKSIEVKTVLDEQADRKGFFAGIQWLRERMTPKSVGVVFFAGHGEKDQDGILYFLPVDFEEKNLAGSVIDADVLKRQLMGIPGRLTLMLDACHSGEIGAGKTRGVGGLTDQLVRDLTAEESGLIVMCSALGHESAQESHAHRHGLFAAALLEGIEGQAHKSPDGAVYLTALDAYVAARVKELSKGQQNPVTGKPTTVRDFPVSKP